MSLVYITHHYENVLDYEKVESYAAPIKKLKYTSKHKAAVKKALNQPYVTVAPDGRWLITDSGKHERRTMGCAKTQLSSPKCFLRKHEGLRWKRLHDHKCIKGADLPPIPKVSELPPKHTCGPKVKTPKSEHSAVMQEEQAAAPAAPFEVFIETKSEHATAAEEPIKTEMPVCQPVCDPCAYVRKRPAEPRELGECNLELPCRTKGGFDKSKAKKSPEKRTLNIIDPCKRVNFIARNIKRMKSAQPKRPPPRYIDTPTGETHNLIKSGLLPEYSCGRHFAKVPCYIREHQKLIKEYKKTCAEEMKPTKRCPESLTRMGVRKMSTEERVALLAGLKANYMEQLKIFQTLSLYTDTPTKRLRKGRLENDLDQLENDIKFIHDNTDIYVSEYDV